MAGIAQGILLSTGGEQAFRQLYSSRGATSGKGWNHVAAVLQSADKLDVQGAALGEQAWVLVKR